MPKRVKVDGKIMVVPDDATPEEIDQISRGSQQDRPQFSARPEFPSLGYFKEKGYALADKVTNALPAIGGIGGGIAGGTGGTVFGFGFGGPPGAAGGAALGGAAGESARQLARRAIFPPSKGWDSGLPKTSGEAAGQIYDEGLKQGAYELGGQALRGVGKAIAPKLAEAAAAPGKRLLKTIPEGTDSIGDTLLKDTSGVRPKTIVNQLDTKIADHSAAEDTALESAKKRGVTVPLAPARQVAQSEVKEAVAKNSAPYIKDVGSVVDQLTNQYGANGQPLTQTVARTRQTAGFVPQTVASAPKQVPIPLPDVVDPVRARQLRQGIDLSIGSWNPESQQAIAPLQKRVYGALTGEIHSAVPDALEHDAAMTRMIPARDAVYNTSFNPGLTRSVAEKFIRPTGALVGGAVGSEEGYRHGGVGGAIAGGLTGLVVPNALASPTGLMTAARVANSSVLPTAVRSIAPVVEGQITKPDASKKKRPDGSEYEEQ